VHPTRIHYNNGLCKFNLIGLPYNFKKLLKCTNYSGHVNYSAPEIISESEQSINSSNSTFENDDYVGEGNFTEKAETWSLGCCLYYLVTKMDPFEGASVKETKQNILKLKLNRPKEPIDPVVNSIIMKCFERDPAKRLDVKGIIKYQDSLEMITFGDYISQINFDKIYAESQRRSEVVQRAIYDTKEVDYTNKSLDLRNNPWFFSKNYSYTDRPKDGNYTGEEKKAGAEGEECETSN
jgi:serine/threonine protein kinase